MTMTTNPALSPIIKALEAHHEILRELEGNPHLLNKSRDALTDLRALLHSEARPSKPKPDPWAHVRRAHEVHGMKVDIQDTRCDWVLAQAPDWSPDQIYRLTPSQPCPKSYLRELCGGMEPHRLDGWTVEMLPEGWRPLCFEEDQLPEDDEWDSIKKTWVHSEIVVEGVTEHYRHVRTRRPAPLPQPEQKEPCPDCDGYGTCETCHGTGVLPPQPEPSQEKWAEERRAQAEGKTIQRRMKLKSSPSWSDWVDMAHTSFPKGSDRVDAEYRIKPTPPVAGSAGESSARMFDDASRALSEAAKKLLESEGAARRTTAHHLHRLEQIEIHLRGVISGKFDGKQIAEFLLGEYFKDSAAIAFAQKAPEATPDPELIHSEVRAIWQFNNERNKTLFQSIKEGNEGFLQEYLCGFVSQFLFRNPSILHEQKAPEGVEVPTWSDDQLYKIYCEHDTEGVCIKGLRGICDAITSAYSSLLAQKDGEIADYKKHWTEANTACQQSAQKCHEEWKRAEAAESRAESLQRNYDGMCANRDRFCHEINVIGHEVLDFQSDNCAPEAVSREVKALVDSLREKLATTERERDEAKEWVGIHEKAEEQFKQERDEARQQLAASGWVAWKERKPTNADGDSRGLVLYRWNDATETAHWSFPFDAGNHPVWWMRIPPPPVKEGGEPPTQ